MRYGRAVVVAALLFQLPVAALRLQLPTTSYAVTRRSALGAALVGALMSPTTRRQAALAAEPSPTFEQLAASAFAAFEQAKYADSERLWKRATAAYPSQSLGWINLAVALVINASDEMTLGVEPTGRAKERLEEALTAIDQAEALGSGTDALMLNSRGNALGLLLRWEDARAAYAASAAAAQKDFASIPRSNEALVLLQLDQLEQAEVIARRLVRRDPNFRDGSALLATLRSLEGDNAGAADAFSVVCDGRDGAVWCDRYSTEQVVLGRWTPKAVEAYRSLLKLTSIQLIIKNARVVPR